MKVVLLVILAIIMTFRHLLCLIFFFIYTMILCKSRIIVHIGHYRMQMSSHWSYWQRIMKIMTNTPMMRLIYNNGIHGKKKQKKNTHTQKKTQNVWMFFVNNFQLWKHQYFFKRIIQLDKNHLKNKPKKPG